MSRIYGKVIGTSFGHDETSSVGPKLAVVVQGTLYNANGDIVDRDRVLAMMFQDHIRADAMRDVVLTALANNLDVMARHSGRAPDNVLDYIIVAGHGTKVSTLEGIY